MIYCNETFGALTCTECQAKVEKDEEKRKPLCSEGTKKKEQHKMQKFFSQKRIQYQEEALKDCMGKKKCAILM